MKTKPNVLQIREALEASWDEKTAYLGVKIEGNPALGQCYPTARVVQNFFPKTEIVKGEVWTGKRIEVHFWNVLIVGDSYYHIDLSWQQFPHGSSIKEYQILDRKTLGDSQETTERYEILLRRVLQYLKSVKK